VTSDRISKEFLPDVEASRPRIDAMFSVVHELNILNAADHVDVGNIIDVSEVYTASIFKAMRTS
jgi:hypothetical protein